MLFYERLADPHQRRRRQQTWIPKAIRFFTPKARLLLVRNRDCIFPVRQITLTCKRHCIFCLDRKFLPSRDSLRYSKQTGLFWKSNCCRAALTNRYSTSVGENSQSCLYG